MKRVALHTLGCKLNFAESSTIGREFTDRGYRIVGVDETAEVCVINTCSVTERADRECRQIVRRALRHSPGAFVIVIGCYAQLRPEEILGIPGVDLVLGTNEKFQLFRYGNGFEKLEKPAAFVSRVGATENLEIASSIDSSDRTRAFLKIQDGCDYSCSFCTIPLARGASRSIAPEAILDEARKIVLAGYKEIVLTGVNVGDYGKKLETSLLGLLGRLVTIEGLERIRISSIEPNLLHRDLLEFWLGSDKICKHFHIPLQGGSDALLKGMRRRYLTSLYADCVATIKSADPAAAIGADVIVGFPGETDEIFEETYAFLVDLPVSYLHVFTYSERPQTPAASFSCRVEPRIRFERSERLRILSGKKRRAYYESFVGSNVRVLFESGKENGWMTGLSAQYVRVHVQTDENLVNQIKGVTIRNVSEKGCVGQLVDTSFSRTATSKPQTSEMTLCAESM
jgi:threonylcarbamoyladenosine tRNA methylthiotransferase MtaB